MPIDSGLRTLHCVLCGFGFFFVETRLKYEPVSFPCSLAYRSKRAWQSFCSTKVDTFSYAHSVILAGTGAVLRSPWMSERWDKTLCH